MSSLAPESTPSILIYPVDYFQFFFLFFSSNNCIKYEVYIHIELWLKNPRVKGVVPLIIIIGCYNIELFVVVVGHHFNRSHNVFLFAPKTEKTTQKKLFIHNSEVYNSFATPWPLVINCICLWSMKIFFDEQAYFTK